MATAVKPIKNSPASNPDSIYVQVTPSGNYVQAAGGGDPINLNAGTWTDPKAVGIIGPDQLSAVTPEVNVANAGGYRAEWIPGTTLANGFLKWYAAGGAELAAGAYPAGILAATIMLRIFLRD